MYIVHVYFKLALTCLTCIQFEHNNAFLSIYKCHLKIYATALRVYASIMYEVTM